MFTTDSATDVLTHEFNQLSFMIGQIEHSLRSMKVGRQCNNLMLRNSPTIKDEKPEQNEIQIGTKPESSQDLKLITKVDNVLAKANDLMDNKEINTPGFDGSLKSYKKKPSVQLKSTNAKPKSKNSENQVNPSKQKSALNKKPEAKNYEHVKSDKKYHNLDQSQDRSKKICLRYSKLRRCLEDMQRESSKFDESCAPEIDVTDSSTLDPDYAKLFCIYQILNHIEISYLGQGNSVSNLNEILKKSYAELDMLTDKIGNKKAMKMAYALKKSQYLSRNFSEQSPDQKLCVTGFKTRKALLDWFEVKLKLVLIHNKYSLFDVILQELHLDCSQSKYEIIQFVNHLLCDKMFIPPITCN